MFPNVAFTTSTLRSARKEVIFDFIKYNLYLGSNESDNLRWLCDEFDLLRLETELDEPSAMRVDPGPPFAMDFCLEIASLLPK